MISLSNVIRFLSLTILVAFVSVSAYAAEKEAGKWDAPWRVLLRAGVIEGWTQGTSAERRDLIMPEYIDNNCY